MTIEERLNGPDYNEPEPEEPEPTTNTILIPKGHGTRPTLRLGNFNTEPEPPAVPTLNLLEQMQRELTGHESVGLGFARAYALASEVMYPVEPDLNRYLYNDTLYYDFQTHLGSIEMIEAQDCGESINDDWLVLTDEEANEHTKDYIEQSLWAFNATFLAEQTGLPESAFQSLSELCEGGNEPIMQMIQATCGIDSFVEAAISADGRGHFLARYDGEEREFNNGRMTFYIYRID